MTRVLLTALLSALAVATPGWTQTLQIRPTAPAAPTTVAPATIAMLDTIQTVSQAQRSGLSPVAPQTISMLEAIRTVAQTPSAAVATPAPFVRIVPPAPLPATAPLALVPEPALVPVAPSQAPARPGQPNVVAPAQPAPSGPSPGRPARSSIPRNVRFDITITDSGGPKPVSKTLSLTVSDNNATGSIRNTVRPGPNTPVFVAADGNNPFVGAVPLNVDVRQVQSYEDGSIRANVSVEYQPYAPDAKTQPTLVTANATLIFQDGRKTQILQTSDPLSDRRTTIDVTVTVLK